MILDIYRVCNNDESELSEGQHPEVLKQGHKSARKVLEGHSHKYSENSNL